MYLLQWVLAESSPEIPEWHGQLDHLRDVYNNTSDNNSKHNSATNKIKK